jgi:predicted transcriptional regulator
MALKDDLIKGFFKTEVKKQEKRSSQKAYNRPRLFDDPKLEPEETDLSPEKVESKEKNSGTQKRTQPETNRIKTRDTIGDKPGTNQGQIGDKSGTIFQEIGDKLGTNRGQTGDKSGTNRGQNRGQKNDVPSPIILRKSKTSQLTNNQKPSFLSLSGVKRRVLISLYKLCDFSKNLETSPLSLENVAQSCNTIIDTAKKSLQRLEKEGFIKRLAFKSGRGGWTVYALNEIVYQEIRIHLNRDHWDDIGDKLGTNRGQIEDKLGTESGTQPGTTRPYSSSYLDNTYLDITTTIEDAKSGLPSDWESIDYSPLLPIKFGMPQVRQIFSKGMLSADQVQASIDAFAFDLRVNQKDKAIKVDPLRYFVGILIKGGVYNAPSNYIDPVQASLQKYAEGRKKAQEMMEESLKPIKEEEFQRWADGLSEAEHRSFVPKETHLIPNTVAFLRAKKQKMLEHFEDCIWPPIKNAICSRRMPVDDEIVDS